MKKKCVFLFSMLLLMLAGCSNDDDSNLSDDDSNLSGVERSLVGYWQVVEQYNYSHQEPIEGIQVIVFNSNRILSYYKDGQLQYETQFWAKPVKDYDGYYLYHQSDEDYSQSTYSCTFEVAGNRLTIWESGCFNVSKIVYQRIPGLNDANPEVGVYKYEDNPTTLEGTWHLAKANFSFGGIHEFAASDVTVYFNTNHTMQVINKEDTKEMKPFLDSGFYSYEIIKTETNKYDGTVYTTISIDGEQCTYWFKDGMMTLDFGMAYDAPGYFFKKLKFTN